MPMPGLSRPAHPTTPLNFFRFFKFAFGRTRIGQRPNDVYRCWRENGVRMRATVYLWVRKSAAKCSARA
jgi:hypothetical protein